jgi:signal-transduction protein with cAMP-binding, CBS, and nucleotidyltransferase domain
MRIDSLKPVTSVRLMVIDAGATLQIAALALLRPGIGLLVACDNNGRAAGVISKSDLVRCLTWSAPTEMTATDLMSSRIISCSPNDDLYDIWKMMAAQSLQNVPVLNQDLIPLGMLDIRDAIKALFEQEEYQEHLLANYVAGIGYQ